jgi:hypothetical protein
MNFFPSKSAQQDFNVSQKVTEGGADALGVEQRVDDIENNTVSFQATTLGSVVGVNVLKVNDIEGFTGSFPGTIGGQRIVTNTNRLNDVESNTGAFPITVLGGLVNSIPQPQSHPRFEMAMSNVANGAATSFNAWNFATSLNQDATTYAGVANGFVIIDSSSPAVFQVFVRTDYILDGVGADPGTVSMNIFRVYDAQIVETNISFTKQRDEPGALGVNSMVAEFTLVKNGGGAINCVLQPMTWINSVPLTIGGQIIVQRLTSVYS